MQSNYHTVRKAIEQRGLAKSAQKHGGAKARNGFWNDKHARLYTSPPRVTKG